MELVGRKASLTQIATRRRLLGSFLLLARTAIHRLHAGPLFRARAFKALMKRGVGASSVNHSRMSELSQ